jgi:glycosyltransferase involved in cell wall biosynthesis
MIVKNEAKVIRRCLDSVLPYIDHWVIVDTGSTDGTQDIIRRHLADIPGALHERPWKDFGANRSEALTLARHKCDYILTIDADDVLEVVPGYTIPLELTADAYKFEIVDSGVVYWRMQLVRATLAWRYEGVLHEFVTCDTAGPALPLRVFRMVRRHDGARQSQQDTYRRDAAVLEEALSAQPAPFMAARYRFYLAQSYYDCREWEKALEHYQLRAELGFWQEEVFISLLRVAQIMERCKYPDQAVLDAFRAATQALPARAEGWHGLSRFCRLKALYEEGYEAAEKALVLRQPDEGLYVEPWIYEVGILDEYAANAFWCQRYWESLDANLQILESGKLARKNISRTLANIKHAREKIGEGKTIAARPRPRPEAAIFGRGQNIPVENQITRRIQEHPQTAEWLKSASDGPRLGIVIPYRDREVHLQKLLPHLISFFRRDVLNSKINPLIIVSEQTDEKKFNGGWCKNAGALALANYCDYFCFHDVDYLPIWADYSYTSVPTRIVRWGLDRRPVSTAEDNKFWVVIPRGGFGAVVLVDKAQFLAANGYSNRYEGWGYDDGDLQTRLKILGFASTERDGTFTPLDHDNEGFDAAGQKTAAHIRNEEVYAEAAWQYEHVRRLDEGLTTLPVGDVKIGFEHWAGLDESETHLVCRLKVAHPDTRKSDAALARLDEQ